MSDYRRSSGEDQAYTGETKVMRQRPGQPGSRAATDETQILQERRPPSPAPTPQPPRRARRPIWPVVRTTLLAILGLVLVGMLVFYLQIRSVASQIVVADVRPGAPVASPLVGGMNVLVVGVDERPDHPEEGVRSDTLLVLHLDGAGRWASMLSIPRDTIVNVRDLGETKINVAYGQGYANAEALYGPGTTPQQGGMALAAQTVEQFLGLPERGRRIDYTMQINFDGFATIIDALGGITIDVPKPIVDDEYPTADFGTRRIEFKAGVQRMTGEEALIYARTRHADSDFGRAERQQQVVRAIVAELRGRGALGQALILPKLLGSLKGSVATTMPIGRLDMLAGLGWLGAGLSPDDIGQIRISPETVPNYQEVGSDLIWDPDGVRAVVDTFLTRPSEAARVQVLNGTDRTGLAGEVTIRLEHDGFTVLPAGNAPTGDAQKTVVYDLTGKPRTSRRVADALRAELRGGPPPEGVATDADILVILGMDAAPR